MRAVRDITNQQIEKQQKATILKELIELLDERRLNEAEKKEITKLSINYILNMSVGEFRDVYFGSNNTVAFNEKEISFKNLIIKLSKLYNNTKNTYSALLNPNIFHALLRERIQTTKVSALLPEDSIQIHELESLTTSEVLKKINEIKHRPLLEEETKAREFISEKELEDRQVLLDMARGKSISIQHSKSEREFKKNQAEQQKRFAKQLQQSPLSMLASKAQILQPLSQQDPKRKLEVATEKRKKAGPGQFK